MMERRRMASPASPSSTAPWSSGPRWTRASFIRSSGLASTPWTFHSPQIPHTWDFPFRFAGERRLGPGGRADHFGDVVVADLAGVGEDDDLADQPERQGLHAQHHQQDAQQQQRPVREAGGEEDLLDRDDEVDGEAQAEQPDPEEAEEAQRPARELGQEEDGEDVEQAPDVGA